MKASEIVADAILYWDPATDWAHAPSRRVAKVKVLDQLPQHWVRRGLDFVANPRRSTATTFGILIEICSEDSTYFGQKRVVALNSLRGPYEQAAALVEANRQKRLSTRHISRELNLEQARRQERVIADAAKVGIDATALFPGTTIQIPIEQFETIVGLLMANAWLYGQP